MALVEKAGGVQRLTPYSRILMHYFILFLDFSVPAEQVLQL